MHLAIRADGGPELGYGHLTRSGSVARELLSLGHAVTYATTTPEPVRDVCPDAVDVVPLADRGDPGRFLDWMDRSNLDGVMTDAYPIDTAYQRAVRERAPLAVLQDDARHTVCAHVFVNGNLYAADLDYSFVGPEPRWCLGTEYLLLRDEIRTHIEQEPPWRVQPERAVVTMGGSDDTEVTPTVLRAFDGFDIRVDAIVGPGFSRQQEAEIRAAADEVSATVVVARDPDDLVDRMFLADFAVSTASTTTYELLALGTPIVSLPVADNQTLIARALRDGDIATVLERSADRAAIREAVESYTTDADLREHRRAGGRSLVDGEGTRRVVEAVEELLSR